MKAIRTRYLGPSNVKGSRCKASDEDGNQITIGWDNSLNSKGNHRKAAEALCRKMGWSLDHSELIQGSLGKDEVFVFFDRSGQSRINLIIDTLYRMITKRPEEDEYWLSLWRRGFKESVNPYSAPVVRELQKFLGDE